MSSMSLSTATALPAPARPATRLRITARGRRTLLALASVPLAAGIAFAAIGGEVSVGTTAGVAFPMRARAACMIKSAACMRTPSISV